jgi:hypothetical protein
VAASIACKQLLHAENMVGFFGFSCPKPYRFYTDSKACLHIATNATKLGNVRHLQIRYHLVRCCVMMGDMEMSFSVTEEMVADHFTKLVMAAQDTRLTFRFYSLISDVHDVVSRPVTTGNRYIGNLMAKGPCLTINHSTKTRDKR